MKFTFLYLLDAKYSALTYQNDSEINREAIKNFILK